MPLIQENICGYTIYSLYLLAGCMIEHVNTTAQEWLRNNLYILGQQRQGPKLPIQESGQSSKSSAAFLRDRAVGERSASSSPRLPDQRKAPQSGLNRGDSPPARINPNTEATRIELSGGLIQIEFPRGQRPKMVMDRGSQSVSGSSRPRRSHSYHT